MYNSLLTKHSMTANAWSIKPRKPTSILTPTSWGLRLSTPKRGFGGVLPGRSEAADGKPPPHLGCNEQSRAPEDIRWTEAERHRNVESACEKQMEV
jgi:hypothetical protein